MPSQKKKNSMSKANNTVFNMYRKDKIFKINNYPKLNLANK